LLDCTLSQELLHETLSHLTVCRTDCYMHCNHGTCHDKEELRCETLPGNKKSILSRQFINIDHYAVVYWQQSGHQSTVLLSSLLTIKDNTCKHCQWIAHWSKCHNTTLKKRCCQNLPEGKLKIKSFRRSSLASSWTDWSWPLFLLRCSLFGGLG